MCDLSSPTENVHCFQVVFRLSSTELFFPRVLHLTGSTTGSLGVTPPYQGTLGPPVCPHLYEGVRGRVWTEPASLDWALEVPILTRRSDNYWFGTGVVGRHLDSCSGQTRLERQGPQRNSGDDFSLQRQEDS